MNELLEAFLEESRELATQATAGLLALEHKTDDRNRLDAVFRAVHTLKGGAGIVEFDAMARALHAMEEWLSRVRTGAEPVTPALIGNCLRALDLVRSWLSFLDAHHALPENAGADADRFLQRLQAADHDLPRGTPAGTIAGLARELLLEQTQILADAETANREGRFGAATRAACNVLHALGRTGEAQRLRNSAASGQFDAMSSQIERIVHGEAQWPTVPDTAVESVRTLRVDIERIDFLVKLTGEMTVAKNALGQVVTLARDGASGEKLFPVLKNQHAVLSRLVEELQQSVLGLRVLPLRHVFQRFPRLVRDMAESLDKSVHFTMSGEDAEADKKIVENLAEPLVHVLRNAIDHGVERREQRADSGKKPIATISMAARREGEHVIIEVADDGRGIDATEIRRAALQRGLRGKAELDALSDDQAIELIFEPGFSTAGQVSALSGRGVGMDAVRSAVRRLGGSVNITTRKGEGTTVRFTVPFSVVITGVMTIEAAGQIYGVPLDQVVETHRLKREEIVPLGAAQACVFRNCTIPIVFASQLLGRADGEPVPDRQDAVILTTGGHLLALVIDRIGENLQVMLNPPGGLLAAMRGIAGTALLGDGRVLVVLDVAELVDAI